MVRHSRPVLSGCSAFSPTTGPIGAVKTRISTCRRCASIGCRRLNRITYLCLRLVQYTYAPCLRVLLTCEVETYDLAQNTTTRRPRQTVQAANTGAVLVLSTYSTAPCVVYAEREPSRRAGLHVPGFMVRCRGSCEAIRAGGQSRLRKPPLIRPLCVIADACGPKHLVRHQQRGNGGNYPSILLLYVCGIICLDSDSFLEHRYWDPSTASASGQWRISRRRNNRRRHPGRLAGFDCSSL